MLRVIPVIILAFFFNRLPVISNQSCIRSNELLAAIGELEHRNQPLVSCAAQIEELNSTMQQGLQEIREL